MTEWDQILREKWYSQEEPSEGVNKFVSELKKEADKQKVLDLACGAGRHSVYLAEQQLEVHSSDSSRTGLKQTQERLRRKALDCSLVKCDMKCLPYANAALDALICFRAIYHQKSESIKVTLSEIRRVLKKNGLFLVNFLSKRPFRYGKGMETEQDTFVETEDVEKGVLHHFVDESELRMLMSTFVIVNLRPSEKQVEGKLSSSWIVQAKA